MVRKKWISLRAKRAANLCAERSTKKNGFYRARSAPLTFGLKDNSDIFLILPRGGLITITDTDTDTDCNSRIID